MSQSNMPVEVVQQALAKRRSERNGYVFLAAVAGLGFTAVRLFSTSGLSVTILLLISLSFFALSVMAAVLALQCQISALQRTLAERPREAIQRVLEWSEWAGSIGFVLAVLMLIAAIIVHLSLGGIAQQTEVPAAGMESSSAASSPNAAVDQARDQGGGQHDER